MAKRSEDDYELYLYTIDVYIRLVGALPLDKSLAQFGVQNFSEIGNLDIDDRDFAAVAMRLMLQRKYFVRGKDLFFKGLLKSAEQDFDSGKEVIGLLLADLESLNAQDIEFAFGNGDVVSGLFSNSEDAMYGALLHADRRRIEKLIDVPEYMRILALAPYVAERERLLLRFSDFLRAAGVKPLSRCGEEAAVVSYGSKGFERSIKGSPSWRNLQGRDLGPADIEQIAQATSVGDACILDVVCRFAEALSSKPFDHAALKLLVAPEIFAQWGDFTQAAMIFEDDCGVSSRVRHLKDGAVLVKLLPNVREAFTIEGPQITEGGHEVVLVKRNGTWKIWAAR